MGFGTVRHLTKSEIVRVLLLIVFVFGGVSYALWETYLIVNSPKVETIESFTLSSYDFPPKDLRRFPCEIPSVTDEEEAYTAKLLWWVVENGYDVKLGRISYAGESVGAIDFSRREMFIDPCMNSYNRFSVILHEVGHMFQPTQLSIAQQQMFADEVALRVGSRIGYYDRIMPIRDYPPSIVQAFILDNESWLNEATTTLVRVITK